MADLREQICDDWVIQLTGARKNYAQCLLDLDRGQEPFLSLALALNQPSQLESRIGSILRNNRLVDLQTKPRLLLVAAILLLTSLPLLAMAQLVPLRTVQLSFFSQTDKTSEKTVEKGKKMDGKPQMRGKMKAEKEYEERKSVKVLDPPDFNEDKKNPLFSGPQPGERLPPLQATGIRGDFEDTTVDVIAEADGKPLVLFLQDDNGAGFRGLIGTSHLLVDIANKSEQKIRTSVVFLGDDLAALSKQVKELEKHVPKEVLIGVSPDGREGPGTYGLNRNVAMTILIAKEGKVTHNFAFPQSLLYADPHVLGAIADVMGVEYETMAEWLNEQPAEGERMERRDNGNRSDEAAALSARLRAMVEKGEITGEEARRRYEKAFPRK